METKKCAECGVEFTPRDKRQKYCSKQCAKKSAKHSRGRELSIKDKKELADAMRCTRLASNAEIMRVRKKPKGVSDVRWRIELRRRANPKLYAMVDEGVTW